MKDHKVHNHKQQPTEGKNVKGKAQKRKTEQYSFDKTNELQITINNKSRVNIQHICFNRFFFSKLQIKKKKKRTGTTVVEDKHQDLCFQFPCVAGRRLGLAPGYGTISQQIPTPGLLCGLSKACNS